MKSTGVFHADAASHAVTHLVLGLLLLTAFAQVATADSRDQWFELAFAPEARAGHAAVLDCASRSVLLVAGWGAPGYFNDVWALECSNRSPRWTRIQTTGGPPPGRMQHTLVLATGDHSLIIFGGRQDPYVPLGDVWKLTLTRGGGTWTEITPAGPAPEPRCTASGVYDPINHRLVIFGGRSGEGGQVHGDTWALDLTTPAWTELSPGGQIPTARRSAAAIYDPVGHRMVIFGGWNQSEGFLDEAWALSLQEGAETWERLNPVGSVPGARMGHDATYDYVGRRMLVYGGWHYPPFHYYNDVHALDLDTMIWTQLSPLGSPPPARRDVSAVFFADQGTKGIVVFGGDVYDYHWYGDTFVLLLD